MSSRLNWQLRGSGVGYHKIWHAPAYSAQRRSKYLQESGWRVVKPVLVVGDKGAALALLPACCRLDVTKLERALGMSRLLLANETQIAEWFPDCESGALPGFGRPYRLATVLDSRFLEQPYLIIPGCSRHTDYRLLTDAYRQLERPICADISLPDASLPRSQSLHVR